MPTVVQFTEPRVVELVECPAQELPPGHFRVRTWYSGISTGTELTAFRGTNPYLTKTWDLDRRLFVEGDPTFGYPIRGWGYSEVGEVVEVADDVVAVVPGDVVAGIWGHRSEGVVPVEAMHWMVLPEGMDPLHGVFARVGAIALNGVLAAETRVGDRVAVFGQGVIGLLATQLARACGSDVVAVDALVHRLDLARRLGADETVDATVTGGAGAAIREAVGPHGVDGLVVASGFYQADGIGLRLGEEFHHNRVRVVSSQIGGTPLSLGQRWNQRRLVRTVLRQIASGGVSVGPLVTDVMPAQDVARGFELLDAGRPETLQVVLTFPAAPQ